MFGITHYELFITMGIMLNIAPGSDTIYILSRSISQGQRAGIYSVLGISSGCAVHTLLSALGLSIILAQSEVAFNVLKVAGALYLGYLGIVSILSKNNLLLAIDDQGMSNRKIYLQGLLTNVLNPKVALFFLSFLPQFVDPQNTYGIMPFVLLGLTFFVTGTCWCLLLVYFSSGATKFLRERQSVADNMNKICGGLYLLLGAKLLTAKQ